jgi:hypothetical protein
MYVDSTIDGFIDRTKVRRIKFFEDKISQPDVDSNRLHGTLSI